MRSPWQLNTLTEARLDRVAPWDTPGYAYVPADLRKARGAPKYARAEPVLLVGFQDMYSNVWTKRVQTWTSRLGSSYEPTYISSDPILVIITHGLVRLLPAMSIRHRSLSDCTQDEQPVIHTGPTSYMWSGLVMHRPSILFLSRDAIHAPSMLHICQACYI